MLTDAMITKAAAEMASAINESLPDPKECTHQFSTGFERKLKRLTRRVNHPLLYRTLRSAISIILVATIGFGSVLAISAEARSVVFGWVKEQYGSFYKYFFEGEIKLTESVKYQPGWIPDGCELLTVQQTAGGETYIYSDEQGFLVQFYYIYDPGSQTMYVDTVDYISESVDINGCAGELYLSESDTETSCIVWIDPYMNVLFYISGNYDKEVLINMAENIIEQVEFK